MSEIQKCLKFKNVSIVLFGPLSSIFSLFCESLYCMCYYCKRYKYASQVPPQYLWEWCQNTVTAKCLSYISILFFSELEIWTICFVVVETTGLRLDFVFALTLFRMMFQNTSLAAPGALAHRLQRHTTCNTSPLAESKMAEENNYVFSGH